MDVCDASEGISLIEMEIDDHRGKHDSDHHIHGATDPHIWPSPVNGIKIAGNINKALVKIDPENSRYYSDNTSRLINELDLLIEEIRSRLRELKKRSFLVFHPSWGYFARDFDLIQIPVELAGKEITPDRLSRVIKKAKKEDIRVVFASPQFSRKSADVIAREINGKLLMIDPMKKQYIKNLRSVSVALMESMR
jgi:zinc transport system substrate-binding protein